ncbi:hypothetical protein [Alkalihalobacterium alkalinitrilicum]|uniref:hypothetical protein n=1 Tax=Alkalihalobacterium alkalinitrilicum TaxID=427920 RepID=UPI000995DB5C|nr:hypothetical protein [Alkalihalobacterium alkalinitrilicum]
MSVIISKSYLDRLIGKYSRHFNVFTSKELGSIPLSFYAEYKRRDEKYFMTKSIPIWGVDNQQYVFVWEKETKVTKGDVQTFATELLRNSASYVPSHSEHMSSILLGVILTNKPLEKDVIKEVKKLRKLKFLKFGMNGWIECYVGLVHVDDNEVYVNKKGREYMQHFKVH